MHATLNFITSHYLQIGLALLYVDRALQVVMAWINNFPWARLWVS